MGTATGRVHGTSTAHNDHRRPVQVGVIDRHAAMEQADDVVNDGGHRLAGRAGITVGDLNSQLFMTARDNGRIVLAVVDNRVVEATKARPRVERDVWNPEP